jgi:hypothetical protein
MIKRSRSAYRVCVTVHLPKCVPSTLTVSPSGRTRTKSQFTSSSRNEGLSKGVDEILALQTIAFQRTTNNQQPHTLPSMSLAFNEKIFHATSFWCREQKLARIRVVIFNRYLLLGLSVVHESSNLFEETRIFGIMPIEITYAIGQFLIAIPAQR